MKFSEFKILDKDGLFCEVTLTKRKFLFFKTTQTIKLYRASSYVNWRSLENGELLPVKDQIQLCNLEIAMEANKLLNQLKNEIKP